MRVAQVPRSNSRHNCVVLVPRVDELPGQRMHAVPLLALGSGLLAEREANVRPSEGSTV